MIIHFLNNIKNKGRFSSASFVHLVLLFPLNNKTGFLFHLTVFCDLDLEHFYYI